LIAKFKKSKNHTTKMKVKLKIKKSNLANFKKAASFNDVKFDEKEGVIEMNDILSIESLVKSTAHIFDLGTTYGELNSKSNQTK